MGRIATRAWLELSRLGAAAAFTLTILLLGLTVAEAAGDAQDGVIEEAPRVAFVIGINDYKGLALEPLKNPINDGKLVSASLRRLEFQVIEAYDVTLADIQALFREHKDLIDSAEAVVFYFAGHGFQLEGKNFLVPVDASFSSAADIPLQTIQLDAVIKLLENEDRPTLVFLDACRENPLPDGAELEAQDGLAQIEVGLNTFVAFATEPGKVANGGSGNNSPFALALTKHLETPGLSISDLTIAVRNETRALTLDQQSPWSQESLRAQFYFTERQQLDQSALILAAAEILQDPRQKAAFVEAQNEGLSFQAAVFRARQRGVELLGQPAPANAGELYFSPDTKKPEDEATNIAIASTAPTGTAAAAKGDEVISTLMFTALTPDGNAGDGGAAAQRERERALARQLQTELQRLGCYRMGIDGIWGPGSRRALQDYLRETNQQVASLDPTVEMLNRTSLASGRICRAPVIIKRKAKPAAVARAPRNAGRNRVQSFKQRAVKGTSRGAQRERRAQRKRALPPDLAAGVGIGL